jgi:PAS domain S-box-containing protein
MLLWMLALPGSITFDVLSKISLPVMLIFPLGTVLVGKLILNRYERFNLTKAAQEREKKYRMIAENMADIISTLDMDLHFTYVSPSIIRLRGFTAEEVMEQTIDQVLTPDSLQKVSKVFEEELRLEADGTAGPDRTRTLELEEYKKDGSTIWAENILSFIRDENKKPIEILTVARDVTERKRSEKLLLESEEKYRLLADNTLDCIWLMGMDMVFTYINPAIYKMTGFTVEEWVGSKLQDHCDEKNFEKIATIIQSNIEKIPDNPGVMLEAVMLKKNGDPFSVEISGKILLDEKGEPFGLQGVTRDITQRRLSEQALKESEERFKTLHNASFGGIAIHDKGIILDCNQGLSEITGYSMAELIGMDGLLLIAEKSKDAVMNNILSGYEKPYESFGLHKSGKEYPLRIEARAMPYKGKTVRTVEFRDITEQKQAEKEREKLQAQLIQAQKMESVGRLAGGVAHDYNNALSVIIGFTELAIDEVDPDGIVRENLDEVFSAAKRAADITRQLLAFARKQTIAPKVLDLNENVESMLKMLRRLIGEDIDLAWLPKAGLWPVKVDPSQIDQILANLSVNARDAIQNVGRISIETENCILDEIYCAEHTGFVPGEFVLLSVSDNGCGMGKDILDNIFEPFFTTKDMDKGTGLGLATVYGIVKQNNGFINVYSEPGQGTTVKIYLPRHVGKVKNNLKEISAVIPSGHGETILLVEDDLSILKLARNILEGLDYIVLTAGTPGKGIGLAEKYDGEIHLLVTDVIMPEMNGRELSERLQLLYPDIKHMFMSGYTADVIAHHGVLNEGVRFIQKPFSRIDLAISVRKTLDEQKN